MTTQGQALCWGEDDFGHINIERLRRDPVDQASELKYGSIKRLTDEAYRDAERMIDELAIKDSVSFVSGLTDTELAELVGSAEVACVPSLYEGFSLPTVEAMACGTPLVVSRAGAIPEVVGPDGLCADLVTPGDVGELAGALEALLDDPERRHRMGAAGRERALSTFSWRAVAEATAAAYQRAIDHTITRGD